MGYADSVKGYRLWDPAAHKVIIGRDVIFVEDKKQEENDSTINKSSETTTVHVEKEFIEESSEAKLVHEI